LHFLVKKNFIWIRNLTKCISNYCICFFFAQKKQWYCYCRCCKINDLSFFSTWKIHNFLYFFRFYPIRELYFFSSTGDIQYVFFYQRYILCFVFVHDIINCFLFFFVLKNKIKLLKFLFSHLFIFFLHKKPVLWQ